MAKLNKIKMKSAPKHSAIPASGAIYKFRTIQEMVDRVPSDRIRECCEELGKILSAAKSTAEAVYFTAVDLARKEGKTFPPMPGRIIELPEEIEWIDDGKGECVADIQNLFEIKLVTNKPSNQ